MSQPSNLDDAGLGRAWVVLIQFAICGLAVGVALAAHLGLIDLRAPQFFHIVCWLLLALFAWSLVSWRLTAGSWLDPYAMFLTAAFLFHGGHAYLELADLNARGFLMGRFGPETVLDSLWLVTYALIAMHTGALWGVRPRRDVPASDNLDLREDVRWVGWAMLAVSAPATLLILRELIPAVLAGGYQAMFQTDTGVGVGAIPKILSAFLVPATFFLLCGSAGKRGPLLASGLVLLANAGIQLFLGSRYYAIMPLILYVWLWKEIVRPLPWILVGGVGLVLVFVVFPVLAMTRNVTGEERFSLERLGQIYTGINNPAAATVYEIGGTLMVVGWTLELVPATRDFDAGLTYFYGLLTLMPNFAWDLHPSIAYGSPTVWLVNAVDPLFAARGGSFGYSFIAEAYLSFGWVGLPWIMAGLGFLYAAFVRWAKGAPARLAMLASFANFFTFFVREETALVVRPLIWYSVLPYLAVYVIHGMRRSLLVPSRSPL